MKIGKISGFGKLEARGKWYDPQCLYPTNRIYFVHSGKARFTEGATVKTLGPDRIYFVPERDNFAPIAEDGEPFVHSYADFALISPVKCERVMSVELANDEEFSLAKDVFLAVCRKKDEIKYSDSACASSFGDMFEAAISYLVTRIAEENGADFVSDKAVTRALYLMNRRMNEKISVSDLAAYVYMSEDGFIRRFSKVMGTTPYAYLKKLRLTTAEGMITYGESITRAATLVGYSDAAALLHAMAKEKGK